jgi:hypothetical protein
MYTTSPPVSGFVPALYDDVRLADGRRGSVIGFYRLDDEQLLVLLPTGDTVEAPTASVQPA